jgi:hypothetical protein
VNKKPPRENGQRGRLFCRDQYLSCIDLYWSVMVAMVVPAQAFTMAIKRSRHGKSELKPNIGTCGKGSDKG